ncbi:MAG: hypothetical protein ACRD6W_11640 [Nitrososphaerales archaeon]
MAVSAIFSLSDLAFDALGAALVSVGVTLISESLGGVSSRTTTRPKRAAHTRHVPRHAASKAAAARVSTAAPVREVVTTASAAPVSKTPHPAPVSTAFPAPLSMTPTSPVPALAAPPASAPDPSKVPLWAEEVPKANRNGRRTDRVSTARYVNNQGKVVWQQFNNGGGQPNPASSRNGG